MLTICVRSNIWGGSFHYFIFGSTSRFAIYHFNFFLGGGDFTGMSFASPSTTCRRKCFSFSMNGDVTSVTTKCVRQYLEFGRSLSKLTPNAKSSVVLVVVFIHCVKIFRNQVRECVLSFGAESFVFQFTIQKYKDLRYTGP